jgi:hypothetical protein
MNVAKYKAATFDGDKRNLNKLRRGGREHNLCVDSACLCQVAGPLYYSMEAKLCPTVKLIAATVCRRVLAVSTGPSRSGIARQTGTNLYQWRNSTEGAAQKLLLLVRWSGMVKVIPVTGRGGL